MLNMYLEKWKSKYQFKPGKFIFIPTRESLTLGKQILNNCSLHWTAPDYYFHLKKGGHVSAIKLHKDNTYLAKLDIQNFFESISRSRITRSLKPYFGFNKASEYAHASTVKKPQSNGNMLPFGFPQSQLIASICLQKSALGQTLSNLLKDTDIKISLYVDDIIISSNDLNKIHKALNQIKISAQRSSFRLNDSKSQGPGKTIDVFNLNLLNSNVTVSKERIDIFKNSLINASSEKSIGIKKYVEFVNPSQLDLLN